MTGNGQSPPGVINVVLSVTGPTPDHRVELAVRGAGRAGLPDQTAIATLGAELATADAAVTAFDRSRTPDERIAVGQRLFEAAFREGVAELWGRLRPLAAVGHRLRVCLDVRPDGLRALPWELLRSGTDWVFLNKNVSMWRKLEPAPPAQQADVGPLRVLLVVCNPREPSLMADEELARINGALAGQLGRMHVEILDGPDRAGLSQRIDRLRPHVLHFIGHLMPRVTDQGAGLHFNWVIRGSSAGSVPWQLSTTAVTQLADWSPWLVVINACRTSSDPLDLVGGFAEAFVAAGAHAAVSMQADIDSPAAAVFSAALYAGLGDLAPVDEIVADARRQLSRANLRDADEWALPVLLAGADPADVLPIGFAPTTLSISCVRGRSEYERLRNFLDRYPERRDGWWALDPQFAAAPARSVLVIGGRQMKNHKAGKTWFVHWCLFTCFLRGYRVTYVDLSDPVPCGNQAKSGGTKRWLDVIRMIREACANDRQPEPLSARAFDRFNALLNALVTGEAADRGQAPPDGPVTDECRPFNEDRRDAPERARQVLAGFLAALREASQDRPHVIAVDNADRILPEDFSDYLYPALIRPIAEDRQSVIRLALVASDEWLGPRLPAEENDLWTSVRLEGFNPSEFMRLARDYCQRHGRDFSKLRDLFKEINNQLSSNNAAAVPVTFFDKTFEALETVVIPG